MITIFVCRFSEDQTQLGGDLLHSALEEGCLSYLRCGLLQDHQVPHDQQVRWPAGHTASNPADHQPESSKLTYEDVSIDDFHDNKLENNINE